jgi:hypothetical protein
MHQRRIEPTSFEVFDTGCSFAIILFQERTMKSLIIAITLAVSATSGIAYAADSSGAGNDRSAATRVDPAAAGATTQSRTRAQVKTELVRAEKSGQLAYLDRTLYRGGN